MARIYLDNNSTTRMSEMTMSKMLPFFTDKWGVPSAPHHMGQELAPHIAESLRAIYQLLGVTEKDDIIITESGAEAVNQVILSTYLEVTRETGRNQFITSVIDEAPALMSISRLEKLGCVGKLVQPNAYGQITVEDISEAITPRTALISLSWANGLTGVINPVKEIAALCHQRSILLHLDATHVLGKMALDIDELGVHFVTFNGDHLHGPKGSGALYVKAGTPYSALIAGGLDQAGKRAGALNVAALAGLAQAAREAHENRDLLCTETARLRNKLEEGILSDYPEAVIHYRDQERLPHCTAISFPGVLNEALLFALNRKQLYACIGGGNFQQIGLVLASAGITDMVAHSAINFSLSRYTHEDEIDHAITVIVEAAKKLRKISQKAVS